MHPCFNQESDVKFLSKLIFKLTYVPIMNDSIEYDNYLGLNGLQDSEVEEFLLIIENQYEKTFKRLSFLRPFKHC